MPMLEKFDFYLWAVELAINIPAEPSKASPVSTLSSSARRAGDEAKACVGACNGSSLELHFQIEPPEDLFADTEM